MYSIIIIITNDFYRVLVFQRCVNKMVLSPISAKGILKSSDDLVIRFMISIFLSSRFIAHWRNGSVISHVIKPKIFHIYTYIYTGIFPSSIRNNEKEKELN